MATYRSTQALSRATRSLVVSRQTIRWASSSAVTSSPNKSEGNGRPKPIDDSTSALEYKMHRPSSRRPPPLPQSIHPRAPSAEEAVTNILYNTPPPSLEPYKKHVLNCLVQNEPGVLSRVSGILAARGFNIDSLVVCQTEIRDLSRMCIVLRGQDGVIEQARRQLEDLVPVWAVLDYTNTSHISRELLLVKVSVLGPEYAEQQMTGGPTHAVAYHDVAPTNADPDKFEQESSLAERFERSAGGRVVPSAIRGGVQHEGQPISPSEALIAKNLHLSAIKTLADQFGGKIVDVSDNDVMVELTGKSTRVDAFLKLLRPFGVLEAARSGAMVMPRTPISRSTYDEEEDLVLEVQEMDASLLPPG